MDGAEVLFFKILSLFYVVSLELGAYGETESEGQMGRCVTRQPGSSDENVAIRCNML